jgi:serine/threonine protein kinase
MAVSVMSAQTVGFEGESDGSAHARGLFQLGEVLDDVYEIRALLGEGGMGQVFDARDRVLNREVAIKAYWPSAFASTSDLLRREAQALAAIHHPGLATVFTMGTHTRPQFLVMERIRGISLAALMEQRHRLQECVPLRDALRIILAVADVLRAVHAAGCVHRDVKPSNVMLTGNDRVVLMDFGLFLPENELAERPLLAGSPHYMAPESIRECVRPGAGHLVDLYALGVMAFELVAGRVPFEGGTADELFQRHLQDAPPDLRALAPQLPARLVALIHELLAKDPYDRPDSEDLVWRLRALRENHRV